MSRVFAYSRVHRRSLFFGWLILIAGRGSTLAPGQ